MADTKKSQSKDAPVSPVRSSEQEGRPESPTTAQPLDFDDDADTQTPTKPSATEDAPQPPPKDEAPPKPPRPLSAKEQAENTLKEAFPTIEMSVVKAVLAASGGQVEPAFNALLGMTDPDSQREPEPPARPPRPLRDTSTQQSQLEADELYARQLQEHLSNTERARYQDDRYNENLQGSRIGRPGARGGDGPTSPEERSEWNRFVDDDLPEIRDNIRKGFVETQNTVNRWISSFKKTIDGEDDDQYSGQPGRQAQNTTDSSQQYGRRSTDARRSADMARYDADPQVIGDDFSKLNLRDGDYPPRTSSRPPANPNLFKPGNDVSRTKSPGSGRKVSFQDGPPEEIQDMYSASPKPTTTAVEPPTSGAKTSKWQPLSKADPSPVAENDPFSLGDSDDERDAKPITMHDATKDDSDERLRKAMSEATGDTIGGDESKKDTKAEAKK